MQMDFSSYSLEDLRALYIKSLEEIKDAVLADLAKEGLFGEKAGCGQLAFVIRKKCPSVA
ncbi:MAG: hypothetical protein ACXVMS_17160 [Flavisolibacter sp.]